MYHGMPVIAVWALVARRWIPDASLSCRQVQIALPQELPCLRLSSLTFLGLRELQRSPLHAITCLFGTGQMTSRFVWSFILVVI